MSERRSPRSDPGLRAPPPPRCARCGEPVGVYEPLWWARAAADPVATGWLGLPEAVRRGEDPAALMHVVCRDPAGA